MLNAFSINLPQKHVHKPKSQTFEQGTEGFEADNQHDKSKIAETSLAPDGGRFEFYI